MEIEGKLEEISIDKVCRTCLNTSEESMVSLYDEDVDINLNYFQIINQTFGRIVPPLQNLPSHICSDCLHIVRQAYDFKKKSLSIIATNETTVVDFLYEDENDKSTQTTDSQFIQFDENSAQPTMFDVIFETDEHQDNARNPLDGSLSIDLNTSMIAQTIDSPENEEEDEEIEALNEVAVKEEELEEKQLDQRECNDIGEKEIIDDLTQVQALTEYGSLNEENPFNNDQYEVVEDENVLKPSPKKEHKCEQCSKTFTRLTHLKRHLLSHEEVKPILCTFCNKGFSRVDHLNHHVLSNHSESKPYRCHVPDCKKGFLKEELLRKHIEAKHSDGPKGKEMCPFCQKTFSSKKYLRVHMKVHNGEHRNLGKKDPQNDTKPFLCSECGLRFVRNDYLVIHMRRHLGVKPYKCRFCDKGFPRATDLTVHERYHTNEKTHLCNLCGKGFQRAYNLLVHMRVHTGERPYQCTYCSKSFSQGNDLKAHIRRHTGERFKCELCNEGFIQGYHLTSHKRQVHGLDVKSHIRRVEKFVNSTSGPSSSSVPNNDPEKQEDVCNQIKTEENEYQII